MGIFDRLFNNNQKDNNHEIEKINRDVAQMSESLVIQMGKILPPELKLDYSISSVKLIDALIEKLRSEGNDEKSAENEIMAFGAYIGEVIKRHVGGYWTKPELAGFPKDGATFSVVLALPNGGATNPLGRVLKYFRYGNQYSTAIFVEMNINQFK
jgi:hypothetical protein